MKHKNERNINSSQATQPREQAPEVVKGVVGELAHHDPYPQINSMVQQQYPNKPFGSKGNHNHT